MVSPLGLGLALGGANLASGLIGQGAQARERDLLNQILQKRRKGIFGRTIKGALGDMRSLARDLPPALRESLMGRLKTRQAANLAKLQRSLAATGQTAGSGVYGMAQRSALQDIGQGERDIEYGTANLKNALLGNLARTSMQAGQYFHPLMNQEVTYVDPMQPIAQGMLGYGIGQAMNRGDGGSVGPNMSPIPDWMDI